MCCCELLALTSLYTMCVHMRRSRIIFSWLRSRAKRAVKAHVSRAEGLSRPVVHLISARSTRRQRQQSSGRELHSAPSIPQGAKYEQPREGSETVSNRPDRENESDSWSRDLCQWRTIDRYCRPQSIRRPNLKSQVRVHQICVSGPSHLSRRAPVRRLLRNW